MADKKTQTPTATDVTATDVTATDATEPKLGWNDYAEKLNGRFAMIGLATLLLLEFCTRQDFFTWLGLK
ncbi:MAG: high light inducible protein [Alkalinema sp. RL_2_19]|nr:high light inducible protein [Alkalinema sp. RL_2_19]